MMRKVIFFSLFACLMIGSLSAPLLFGAGTAFGWKEIMPDYPFAFPRDHGAHPDYRTEWWYFTGNVRAADGREFGYQHTIFRQGISPAPLEPGQSDLRPRQVLFAHFAIADIARQSFRHAERIRRSGAGLAEYSQEEMDIRIEDWSIRRESDDSIRLYASDREQEMAIDFTVTPQKPLVFQGVNGYSQKGEAPGNASFYTSWTRLQTQGTLSIGGETFPVEGTSWFDHEFGTSQLGEGVVGWDWFSLILDDRRELMIYQLRDEQGRATVHSSGTLIGQDGGSVHLGHEDFTIESLDTWTSPDTGGVYPSRWKITVPQASLELEVETRTPDAELDVRSTINTVYWEGPVRISGTVTGQGYAELTGYADSLAQRF
jgi:predicted secreted hydrolase